jgi:myo-inositol-hexaphosphate 3-phosphohydrolase
VFAAMFAVAMLARIPVASAAFPSVTATVETDPVHNAGDAADDSAVWIHPTNPSLSVVIGADKSVGGGLNVYDLAGHELHFYADGRMNNVDLRYNFPLGATNVALVGATNRLAHRIDFYRVNVADRSLTKVGSVTTSSAITTPRGFAMYHSPASGKYYAFVTDSGHTDQYELNGTGGAVTGTLVRQFAISGVTEGLVADDELQRLYVAEEDIGGIWRYGAEPDAGGAGVKIVTVADVGGPIVQDIKGISMYYGRNGTGYLLAASQGSDSFHVLNRGDNAYRGAFEIAAGNGIDKVTSIDGIDVTNFNLGGSFPQGVFISHDDVNDGFNQNHKLVPWQAIAAVFDPPLVVDPVFDPRSIGGGGGPGPDTTPPETVIDSGPSGTTNATSATIAFSANEPATFTCRLDAGAFVPCTSPVSYSGLAPGTHTFDVRATDTAGNADSTPASRSWIVDTSAPPPPPPPPPPSTGIRREAIATAVNLTASANLTIDRPAGTAAGEVLVACLALNGGTVSAVPAGWSTFAAVTSVSNPHVFGYYKVVTPSEPTSYSWTLSMAVQNSGGIARYSGVKKNAVLAGYPTTAASATVATSGTVPAVTTGVANAMVVGCMATNASTSTLPMSPPAAMVQAWNLEGKRQLLADVRQPAAGSSGDKSWSFGAGRAWAGWLTALSPK